MVGREKAKPPYMMGEIGVHNNNEVAGSILEIVNIGGACPKNEGSNKKESVR